MALNIFPKTALFDTATLAGELTWMQWSKVTQNHAVFKGSSNYVNADGSTPIDKPTRNYYGLALNFTPTWFQVWPGVDLSAPATWSQGISGNAAVLLGGNKNAGTWSAGVAADIYQKYKFQADLQRLFRRLLDDGRQERWTCLTARSPRSPTVGGCRSPSRQHSDEDTNHVQQIIAGRGLRGDIQHRAHWRPFRPTRRSNSARR